MRGILLQEFKPTIIFLLKFVGIYLVGNLIYGMYVTGYEPAPDPATHWVTRQTATIMSLCGWPADVSDSTSKPITNLTYAGKSILAVFEGCNGINVMVIFLAFLFAFGPISKSLVWYIPFGIVVIHLLNLARISLLFLVSVYRPDYMYFMHKYFFTAILYVAVFVLWVLWVRNFTFTKQVPV